MRAHWEARADQYSQARVWSSADARIVELLSGANNQRLLEIGFGSGCVASRIMLAYPQVRYCGLDLSINFLQHAKNRLGNEAWLMLGSADHTPFGGDQFQFVLEMDAIHHFPREAIPGVVLEIARMLAPGGHVLMAEDWALAPTNERESLALSLQSRRPLASSGREYHPTEAEWLSWLGQAGLEIDLIEYAERPLNFAQFEGIDHPAAQKELAQLKGLWGNEIPATKMLILRGKKE